MWFDNNSLQPRMFMMLSEQGQTQEPDRSTKRTAMESDSRKNRMGTLQLLVSDSKLESKSSAGGCQTTADDDAIQTTESV